MHLTLIIDGCLLMGTKPKPVKYWPIWKISRLTIRTLSPSEKRSYTVSSMNVRMLSNGVISSADVLRLGLRLFDGYFLALARKPCNNLVASM